MRAEQPSEFEAAIFRYIAERIPDSPLQLQLSKVEILSRENTGVGCYSELVTYNAAPATLAPYGRRGPLSGPHFKSACVDFGGGTLLWFHEGRASCLEIFSYGEFFPENHANLVPFELTEGSIGEYVT
jgi:hypothetical protein